VKLADGSRFFKIIFVAHQMKTYDRNTVNVNRCHWQQEENPDEKWIYFKERGVSVL
jgi:hypothetical protein